MSRQVNNQLTRKEIIYWKDILIDTLRQNTYSNNMVCIVERLDTRNDPYAWVWYSRDSSITDTYGFILIPEDMDIQKAKIISNYVDHFLDKQQLIIL